MENHKLVLPSNLNQYGYLFGGDLLKWVDEYAWIAVTLEYPDCTFVTRAMDKVEFKRSVREGTILKFIVEKTKTGNTSVQYLVNVFRGNNLVMNNLIFNTKITFVRIDQNGQKAPLPKQKFLIKRSTGPIEARGANREKDGGRPVSSNVSAWSKSQKI